MACVCCAAGSGLNGTAAGPPEMEGMVWKELLGNLSLVNVSQTHKPHSLYVRLFDDFCDSCSGSCSLSDSACCASCCPYGRPIRRLVDTTAVMIVVTWALISTSMSTEASRQSVRRSMISIRIISLSGLRPAGTSGCGSNCKQAILCVYKDTQLHL